ncbi:MAG: hypothetical protein M3478_10385, partial [Planctomycetota bacterium]|nr:hypothetical protein [Planctomycetota bacterium]
MNDDDNRDTLDMMVLDDATRQLRSAALPGELPESLVRCTAAAGRMRHHRRRRMAALSGVAAMIAISALIIAWFVIHGGGELAFADVVAQVRQTQTLTADVVRYGEGGEAVVRQGNGTLYIKGPRLRHEFLGPDGVVSIADHGSGRSIELKTAARSAVHTLNASDLFDLAAWLRNSGSLATKPLGERTLDGKRLVGFGGVMERQLRNGTVERSGNFAAWVDPASKLPVRVILLDEQGRERQGFENIRFDVPLADALFDLDPPAGYAVQDRGGLTAEQLKPPATPEEAAKLALSPGEGLGDLKFGATLNDVAALLGEPEITTDDQTRAGWKDADYPSRGVIFSFGPEGGLRKIWAYDAITRGANAHPFPGKTERGIGIGSTGADVEAAFGPADYAQPSRTSPNRYVRFPRIGLSVSLRDDKVASISMTAPAGPGIELPTSAEVKRRAEAIVLKPGVGVDELKLGATREQAIALFGPPADPSAGDLQYPVIGMSLNFDKEGRLNEVWGSIPRKLGNDGNAFFGKTDRGVRIDATRGEVEAAYGKPDEIEEPPGGKLPNVAASEIVAYLNYHSLGLMVELKGGRVTGLAVQRPK